MAKVIDRKWKRTTPKYVVLFTVPSLGYTKHLVFNHKPELIEVSNAVSALGKDAPPEEADYWHAAAEAVERGHCGGHKNKAQIEMGYDGWYYSYSLAGTTLASFTIREVVGFEVDNG